LSTSAKNIFAITAEKFDVRVRFGLKHKLRFMVCLISGRGKRQEKTVDDDDCRLPAN
jgi:hypothetical protein